MPSNKPINPNKSHRNLFNRNSKTLCLKTSKWPNWWNKTLFKPKWKNNNKPSKPNKWWNKPGKISYKSTKNSMPIMLNSKKCYNKDTWKYSTKWTLTSLKHGKPPLTSNKNLFTAMSGLSTFLTKTTLFWMLPCPKDWLSNWSIKVKTIKLSWLLKPISRKTWKTAKLGESWEESYNKTTKTWNQLLVS